MAFKSALDQAAALQQPRKIDLDFANMKDKELLSHFLKSSGFGFTGSLRNGKFRFDGPDWDKAWNPMSRKRLIEELNERKRIDEEENGDWFDYLNDKENPIGMTEEYRRKSDGHNFVLYPGTPDSLFSTQDESGKSDVRLNDGQLDSDFEFIKGYVEEQ